MRSSVRRFVLGAVVFVVAGLVAVGLVTGVLVSAGRSLLYATGGLVDGGSPTITPAPTPSTSVAPRSEPPSTSAPDSVLQPLGDASAESRTRLSEVIAGVSTGGMGGTWSGTVSNVAAAGPSFRHNGTAGYIPASTMKLLTSAAALEQLGPDHRFTTSVVPGAKKQIVLVGGGDPYLATKPKTDHPATSSMLTLAAETARSLEAAERTSVVLGYDDTLFSGPGWSPRWPSTYGDQVTRVSALMVDEGRVSGYSPGPRVADPAGDAARTFAALLRKQGIKVTDIVAAKAAASAEPLASTRSMPLSAILGETLLHSDNDAAETLLRQVGLASGHTGSFQGGVAGVEKALKRIDAWDETTTLFDGSGLSRDNRVSSDQLVKVIKAAAAPDGEKLRSLLTGMPTAAVDGSLRYRYGDETGRPGRGVLRAKTGTLTKVHSLAGWTVTRDGSVLAFAFVANGMANEYASTQWLEHVTAAVAGCGCS